MCKVHLSKKSFIYILILVLSSNIMLLTSCSPSSSAKRTEFKTPVLKVKSKIITKPDDSISTNWQETERVPAKAINNTYIIKPVIGKNGEIALFWVNDRVDQGQSVYFKEKNTGGWGVDKLLIEPNEDDDPFFSFQDACADSNDGINVVWFEGHTRGDYTTVFAMHKRLSNGAWSTPNIIAKNVDSGDASLQNAAVLVPEIGDNLGLVYEGNLSPEESYKDLTMETCFPAKLFFNEYSISKGLWANTVPLQARGRFTVRYPSVTSDRTGILHMVWQKNVLGWFSSRTGLTTYQDFSTKDSKPHNLGTGSLDSSPIICADKHDNKICFWISPDQKLVFRMMKDGRWWQLDTVAKNVRDYTAVGDASGNVHLTWISQERISYQKWNGVSWSKPTDIVIAEEESAPSAGDRLEGLKLTSDLAGNIYLFWTDNRTSIYFKKGLPSSER